MSDIELIRVEKVDEELINEIVRRILKVINPLKIILFGSWAYGRPNKDSDLDILVIVEDNINSRHEIASEIYGVLLGFLISKDIVVATLSDIEDWKNVHQAFITTIVRKGKVIYERKN
jgi:predicted nucleotidyltransferase